MISAFASDRQDQTGLPAATAADGTMYDIIIHSVGCSGPDTSEIWVAVLDGEELTRHIFCRQAPDRPTDVLACAVALFNVRGRSLKGTAFTRCSRDHGRGSVEPPRWGRNDGQTFLIPLVTMSQFSDLMFLTRLTMICAT